MPRSRHLAVFLMVLLAATAPAATRLLVTVTDPRTGESVMNLKAGDFTVLDDKEPRAVETAELTAEPVDIMLLLDTSLVGEAVQPLAANLIRQLDSKEQMAVVSFASSADLVQDFTSSRVLLNDAVRQVKSREHASGAGCTLCQHRWRLRQHSVPSSGRAADHRTGGREPRQRQGSDRARQEKCRVDFSGVSGRLRPVVIR